MPVLAAASPADCFDRAIEAVDLATRFMTPVMLLSDGYIANAAEPWKIPEMAAPAYAPRPVHFHADPDGFQPFQRDPRTGARPWAVPGTPGLEHRIGGLEKDFNSGNVSYDRDNHQLMTDARVGKIAGIADHLPPQTIEIGPDRGKVAVLTWGSPYGPARVAVVGGGMVGCELAEDLARAGHRVSLLDRHAYPLAGLLPEAAGRRLLAAQRALGIAVRPNVAVAGVGAGDGIAVGRGENVGSTSWSW